MFQFFNRNSKAPPPAPKAPKFTDPQTEALRKNVVENWAAYMTNALNKTADTGVTYNVSLGNETPRNTIYVSRTHGNLTDQITGDLAFASDENGLYVTAAFKDLITDEKTGKKEDLVTGFGRFLGKLENETVLNTLKRAIDPAPFKGKTNTHKGPSGMH